MSLSEPAVPTGSRERAFSATRAPNKLKTAQPVHAPVRATVDRRVGLIWPEVL